MSPRLVAIISVGFNVLLLALASFLLWTGRIGPGSDRIGQFPPPLDRVVVLVNNKEVQDFEQPVLVPKGWTAAVRVEVYHQGQLRNPGEFTYQWCFEPIINNSLHEQQCEADNYRKEINRDYKPDDLDEQKLAINIRHVHYIFRDSTVIVRFKPEAPE